MLYHGRCGVVGIVKQLQIAVEIRDYGLGGMIAVLSRRTIDG
jgi:hypothetical protein